MRKNLSFNASRLMPETTIFLRNSEGGMGPRSRQAAITSKCSCWTNVTCLGFPVRPLKRSPSRPLSRVTWTVSRATIGSSREGLIPIHSTRPTWGSVSSKTFSGLDSAKRLSPIERNDHAQRRGRTGKQPSLNRILCSALLGMGSAFAIILQGTSPLQALHPRY